MATRKELIEQINRNYAEIQAGYLWGEETPTQARYRKGFGQITGNVNEKGIAKGNVSRFTKERLQDLLAYQNKYLNDPWTNAERAQELFERARARVGERYDGITQSQYKGAIDTFNDYYYSALRDSNFLSSEQILDLYYENEDIPSDVINELMFLTAQKVAQWKHPTDKQVSNFIEKSINNYRDHGNFKTKRRKRK